MKKLFISIVLVSGLVFSSYVWSARDALLNSAAPDFTLRSLDGPNQRLSEQRGDVVLINFWASWCGPCRQEMPLLDELNRKYEPMGFKMFGINVEEDSSAAEQMLSEVGVGFPILFDPDNKVSEAYRVIAMPTTVVINRDGEVSYVHHGYKPGDEQKYQEAIRKAIRQ